LGNTKQWLTSLVRSAFYITMGALYKENTNAPDRIIAASAAGPAAAGKKDLHAQPSEGSGAPAYQQLQAPYCGGCFCGLWGHRPLDGFFDAPISYLVNIIERVECVECVEFVVFKQFL
jgi:hypothetical protein